MQDWDDFITALVTRYKGKIEMYELWNEPYNARGMKLNDVVALTTHEYNIIRSIDPGALICAPSGEPQYMDRYFEAGGPKGVDCLTFHGHYPQAEGAISDIDSLKRVMAKHGLSDKMIWATEGGHWGCNNRTIGPDDEMAFVARVQLLDWSNGVLRHYWYAWDTCATLWSPASGIFPAGTAYGQVYEWMAGASMTTPCSMTGGSVWSCGLTRPGGYQALAIWTTSGTESYKPESQYKQYRDVAGSTYPIRGAVTIGVKPILLETGPEPAPP